MVRAFAAAVAAVYGAFAISAGASAEDFYKDKSVRLIVSSAAGGSYDVNARVLAAHLPRHVPGAPTIVVQFMPGANGLLATNHVYNIAGKDGLTIGLFNRNIVPAEILGNKEARFKADQFNWLGTTASFADDAYVMLVRSAVPHKTVEEMRNAKPQVVIGNAGTAIVAVLNEALALNLKVVEGYERDTLDIAFERAEIDGLSISWSGILSRKQRWIDDKVIRPMIQVGRTTRLPALADVPTARELATDPNDRALIELAEAPMLMAYPFALPPGVPSDRVTLLQSAFEKTVVDPAYVTEMKAKRLEYSPRNAAELRQIIADIVKAPKSAIERFNALNKGRGG